MRDYPVHKTALQNAGRNNRCIYYKHLWPNVGLAIDDYMELFPVNDAELIRWEENNDRWILWT